MLFIAFYKWFEKKIFDLILPKEHM